MHKHLSAWPCFLSLCPTLALIVIIAEYTKYFCLVFWTGEKNLFQLVWCGSNLLINLMDNFTFLFASLVTRGLNLCRVCWCQNANSNDTELSSSPTAPLSSLDTLFYDLSCTFLFILSGLLVFCLAARRKGPVSPRSRLV